MKISRRTCGAYVVVRRRIRARRGGAAMALEDRQIDRRLPARWLGRSGGTHHRSAVEPANGLRNSSSTTAAVLPARSDPRWHADPDGYTIGVVFDTHAVNPSLIPNLPFDTT